MLLQEIADVETPGYIYGDNEASMFFAKNKQVSNRTNHVDVREHFIRECVDEGSTELRKVKSENNSPDIMTKIYQCKLSNETEKKI